MKIQNLYRILSGYLSNSQFNANMDRVETALQNTLSRDGSTPNDMEANLDMGDHRIINLGEPVNPNDAVRLQDITDIISGDLEINTAWDNITDKPTSFPPSSHSHSASSISDLEETVEDIIGSKVIAGNNINVLYNDTTGETTIEATGTVSTAWGDITGKPSTFTPSAHTHTASEITDFQEAGEDLIGSSIIAGANVSVSYSDGTGKTTIASTGGSGGFDGYKTLESFGGVGDNVTDNAAAIAAAVASTSDLRVYCEGTYYTTTSLLSNDWWKFFGPGKFRFSSGEYRPAEYHNITTMPPRPQPSPINIQYFYGNDNSRVQTQHWNFGASGSNLRMGISEPYFESVLVPEFVNTFNWNGYSGFTARTTSSITTGATSVSIDVSNSGGSDLVPGRSFVFSPDQDSTALHAATVVSMAGSTLTFTPAIPAALTIPIGYVIYTGKRTHHSMRYDNYRHNGGGDAYAHIARMTANYVPTQGQQHVFNTSTIGLFGGDLNCSQDGNFMTGIEMHHLGQASDCAAVGVVLGFERNNDTGARGAYWSGIAMQSYGTKAMNSAISLAGKFTVGIDLVGGPTDFGTNFAAIGMKLGDRIHMNMTPTTRGPHATVGDTFPATPLYIGSALNGATRLIELQAGVYRMRLQENGGWTSNASLSVSNNITSSAETSGATVRTNGSGGNYRYYFGPGNGTFIEYDGGTVNIYKSGALVASW